MLLLRLSLVPLLPRSFAFRSLNSTTSPSSKHKHFLPGALARSIAILPSAGTLALVSSAQQPGLLTTVFRCQATRLGFTITNAYGRVMAPSGPPSSMTSARLVEGLRARGSWWAILTSSARLSTTPTTI